MLGSTDELDRQNFGESIDLLFWDQAINHALDHEYKDMESIPAGKLLQTLSRCLNTILKGMQRLMWMLY